MDLESPRPLNDRVASVQELFLQHAALIKGFILALLPDYGATDDVFQEVFLVAVQKADTFQPGTSFLAWVRAIARLKVLEASRAKRLTGLVLSSEVIESLSAAMPPETCDGLSHMKRQALDACLDRLAPQAKRIVEMRYQQAESPAAIADRLQWTVDSVHVALSKARTALRECVRHRLALSGDA